MLNEEPAVEWPAAHLRGHNHGAEAENEDGGNLISLGTRRAEVTNRSQQEDHHEQENDQVLSHLRLPLACGRRSPLAIVNRLRRIIARTSANTTRSGQFRSPVPEPVGIVMQVSDVEPGRIHRGRIGLRDSLPTQIGPLRFVARHDAVDFHL